MIDYGIQNEQSHIRVHVCPQVRRVYVYPTTSGICAINSGKYVKKNGYQKNVEFPTAEGYLVPPSDIEKCVALVLRDVTWDKIGFGDNDDTSEKGRKAVSLVRGMIKAGLFPLPAMPHDISDRELQIDGADIVVIFAGGEYVIQVKCDWGGGEREIGGTGNLFLQVAELNPLKAH